MSNPATESGSTKPIFSYVYASSAAVPFSTADLLELLAKSRRNNAAAGITGILLYRDGNFLQALEGEEEAVRQTLARIEHDPRHRGILRLLQGQSSERQFPDWSMGFRDLNSAEAKATPGFSEFMNESLAPESFSPNPTRCKRLLQVFRTLAG